jgi:glycosyltransferase involved in cell wall biosynthesis
MPVSLILPCYNPQQGWEIVVCTEYRQLLLQTGEVIELILVLDGVSKTVTEQSLFELKKEIPDIKYIQYPGNRGKGFATRAGVSAASGDIILYTDVDFPYTVASICEVYNALKNNTCDVAAGVKNDAYYKLVPAMRRIISRMLRWLISMLLSMPLTDTQCGLKGMRKAAKATFLNTKINRYLFDLEFIYSCYRSGNISVKAIPVVLKEDVRFRSMNYRILLPEMVNFLKLVWNKGR